MNDIITTGRKLWELAEPGFFENSTHSFLSGLFADLGFSIKTFDGIPGFVASLPGATPRIALIADMDALPIPGDEDGRYIHSCGHHMQMTNLYGAAGILKDAGSPALANIAFIAAPAEEYIDFDRREPFRASGTISHLSGKQELLHRGIFKNLEMVVSTHGAGFPEKRYISSVHRMSGFDVLKFTFHGKASHAGGAAHLGVNAQNAGALFLQACAFLRETFPRDEHIVIHPVMKLQDGQSVNIIPDAAFIETYVRGASPEAIATTTAKLKAAAEGSARAIGATVDVEVISGYAPFVVGEKMHDVLKDVVEEMGELFIDEAYGVASSDMGDVSQAVPSIMLGLPGANGLFHNPGFQITDEDAAFVLPSKIVARYLETLFDSLKKPV